MADIADALPNAVRKRLRRSLGGSESYRVYPDPKNPGKFISSDEVVQGMKSLLRENAVRLGDDFAEALTEGMSASKHRVEVLPIMNNDPQAIFVLNGSPYRASDLRRIFVRNGLYNNAFKGVTMFLRNEGAIGFGVDDFVNEDRFKSALSPSNSRAVDSMVSVIEGAGDSRISELMRDAYHMGRSGASRVFEHGLESMDAFADLERTGMAVSFIELGVPPELAAKMVVKAVYDYRGSLTRADRTLFKRAFMPFFGFQKNAMAHFTDLLASPRGRFFARVMGRMPRMTMEALSTLYFETVVGPYGVNTTAMNEAEINLYYEARSFFELGLGDDVSAEDLLIYREMLPEDAKDISDEELMDYSFDGWTVRDGYNGYDNVPEDMRATMRYLLLARGQLRANGRYVKMSDGVIDSDLRQQFVQMGATMAVVDEPSLSALPAWAANRYPTVLISPAVMTNSIQESRRGSKGMGDSVGIMLPDNFINAGFEQTAATLATVYAGAFAASEAADFVFSDGTRTEVAAAMRMLANSATPIIDIRGGGSPGLQQLMLLSEVGINDGDLYVELDPFIARLMAGTLIPIDYTEGDDDLRFLENLTPGTRAMLNKLTRMSSLGGLREVEYPSFATEARTAVVSEEGGKRVIKYLDQDYEEVQEAYNSRRKKPFLMGRSALLFKVGPLGRVNAAFLRLRTSPQEDAMAAEENLKNELTRLVLSVSRSAGLRVMPTNESMTARMSKPDLLVDDE